MMTFSLIVLAGYAGRDPETREVAGTNVTSFSLAVDTYRGKDESGKAKEEAIWVIVNAWGKLSETVAKLVKKAHQSLCPVNFRSEIILIKRIPSEPV